MKISSVRAFAFSVLPFLVGASLVGCSSSDEGGTDGASGTGGTSGSGTATLKKEGEGCTCADSAATLCQSTAGPCESTLACITGSCIDTSKKCTQNGDCATGYSCTKMLSSGAEIGTYCKKQ